MTLPSTEHLTARAARGAMTLGLRMVLFSVLNVARMAVVARLLGPSELGLFGLLMVVAEAARSMTASGARTALIQREELSDDHVATYWAFEILQGLLGALIVFGAIPLAVDASLRGRAIPLAGLVAVGVLLPGFANPGRMLAERDAKFERIAVIESVAATTDLVAVVVLAFVLRSAAALAWSTAIRAAVEVVLSFALFPRSVRPGIRREAARTYLKASGHFVALSTGSYIMIYGDNLTVAKVLGTTALGFYAAAYRLTELPFAALLGVTNRVVFPVVSRLQRDARRLSSTVALLMESQILFLMPIATAFVVFARVLIVTMYGKTFEPSIPVLQALFLAVVGRNLSKMIVPMRFALGHFDSRLKGFEVAVFLCGVLVGVRFAGLPGVAVGAGVGYAVAAGWRLWFLRQSAGVGLRAVARMLLTSAAFCAISTVAALGFQSIRLPSERISACGALIVYCLVYTAAVFVVRRPLVRFVARSVRDAVGTRRAGDAGF